jgi:hypothetical protein
MLRNDLATDLPELNRLLGQQLVVVGISELGVGAVYVQTLRDFTANDRDLLVGRRLHGRHLPTRDTVLVNTCDLEVNCPPASLHISCPF